MEREGKECSVAGLRRMMLRMFNKLEDEFKEHEKPLHKQKQLNGRNHHTLHSINTEC
jgi:hypothetical protein